MQKQFHLGISSQQLLRKWQR